MRINPVTAAVVDPPIGISKSWILGREFPAEHPLLDLSQAVPGYPPPDELRALMVSAIGRAETSSYPPSIGIPVARDATAAHLSRAYAADVPVDHVMMTTGCNQAFCLAVGALAAPGDEWIIPVPYYFDHDMWLRAQGVTPRYVHAAHTDYVPDVDEIATLITPRTRGVLLVTPNNPTGAIYPPELIHAVYELCAQHNVALVLDETYKDFRPTADPPHDLFNRPDWPNTLVHLFSFSKRFSLAGYRAGSLTADPSVIREAVKLADCMTVGAPRVTQEAVAYGLAHLDQWVELKRVEMNQRVSAFRRAILGHSPQFEIAASGAFFAWLRHPFPEASVDVARRLLDEQHVLCIPGEFFGPGHEQHLRVAFGNAALEDLPEVAVRLGRLTAP